MYIYKSTAQKQSPLWRYSDDPSSEAVYPGYYSFSSVTGSVPRWAAHQHAITMVEPDSAGVLQAVLYNVDTLATQVLTHDSGNKAEVWMWQAPDFNGASVMITVVDGTTLRVYLKSQKGWSLINSFAAGTLSPGSTAIYSPQYQVYQGHSYVAFQVGTALKDPGGSIWLVSIDPRVGLARQISDQDAAAIRNEPEPFQSDEGFYVFYSQQETADGPISLRRAATGL